MSSATVVVANGLPAMGTIAMAQTLEGHIHLRVGVPYAFRLGRLRKGRRERGTALGRGVR